MSKKTPLRSLEGLTIYRNEISLGCKVVEQMKNEKDELLV